MSSVVIMAFITFVAAIGISVFYAKFTELNLYSDLQHYAFEAVNTMKNGIPINDAGNIIFFGIASARTINLSGAMGSGQGYSHILCEMAIPGDGHVNDDVEFWFDRWDGRVLYNYTYGQDHPSRPITLLPVDHADKIRVTNLWFRYHADTDPENSARNPLIRVGIEAQMKVTEQITKKVAYETMISTVRIESE